jgi:hypothetical protein
MRGRQSSIFMEGRRAIETSMTKLRALLWLILLSGCSEATAGPLGVDIDGAWTSNSAYCGKIFSKRRNGIAFSKVADLYGGGFIVDGSRIRGRLSRCQVKQRKQDGATIHLVASCAYDIMLSDVQLSLRVVDRNKVTRIFPGLSGMEASYERCELK